MVRSRSSNVKATVIMKGVVTSRIRVRVRVRVRTIFRVRVI